MPPSRSRELDPLVDTFQHLTNKSRPAEALHMLKKVASMVKPLMRVRQWRVGMVAEFAPSEANLLGLNINRGEKICLRLRYPGDDTQFLPLENVVDTMLHELAHIVHGPHNRAFNALWDKLRDELDALVRKGYTGEGFLGKGNKLGGRRIPAGEIKRQARAAAERRRALTKGSGQRLGGRGIGYGEDPRKVIAAAVEKRLRIERGCASCTEKGTKIAHDQAAKHDGVTTTVAEREDENEAAMVQAFIDLIEEEDGQVLGQDDTSTATEHPSSGSGPTSMPDRKNGPVQSIAAKDLYEHQKRIERQIQERQRETSKESLSAPTSYLSDDDHSDSTTAVVADTWTCDICTLINPMDFLMCGACETERPVKYAQPSSSSAKSKKPPPDSVSASSSDPTTRHPAFRARTSAADSLARIDSQARLKEASKPMGWSCIACGSWMEQQWWTCSACGRMKSSS